MTERIPLSATVSHYPRIKLVDHFEELVSTPFENGVNAMCWPRTLAGDYREVVEQLKADRGIMALDARQLQGLSLSGAGRVAVNVMLEDLRLLREQGLSPELNCIYNYLREEAPGAVRTDVYSYHVDSAIDVADTWLCTYHGPPSEGLSNEEAQRRVDLPETRAELLKQFGGADDGGFLDYLEEHCYDLHYAPDPQARPFSFGLGNLWRIAVDYPGSPVPPCIHRAPETWPGGTARLLLIS